MQKGCQAYRGQAFMQGSSVDSTNMNACNCGNHALPFFFLDFGFWILTGQGYRSECWLRSAGSGGEFFTNSPIWKLSRAEQRRQLSLNRYNRLERRADSKDGRWKPKEQLIRTEDGVLSRFSFTVAWCRGLLLTRKRLEE
ncbi:hypothetical protein TWF970_008399 [Orbilia oligospora]|uniref:Uncharacterized protein n=1 Tax=Orbilia oligospora TaxID=2813651 RepID=A0A7C8R679_ORBOL|nr:hypothetical protein TWF970_008399 [Orbilia oligospora]